MSGYAVTAQYYDPFAVATHGAVDGRIAAALGWFDTGAGPIVDIGAGTGLSTLLIASILPDAEIVAIEPDASMRAALMTRIWACPDLRGRVTIMPFHILEAPLPDTISGAVLSASLVHLGPPERERLWPLLGERLTRNGRIIVEVQCPQAEDLAEFSMPSVEVGRMTYSASAAAQRIGSDRQRWRMTYRAYLGSDEVARETATYDCWTISADRILEEAACAGLAGRAVDDLVVLGPGDS